MSKRLLCLFLALTLLAAGAAAFAEEAVPEETAAFAEEAAPEETAAPDAGEATATDLNNFVFYDRVAHPEEIWPFDEDDDICEIWFPRMHDCDAALIRCGGEDVLIDCCDSEQVGSLLELMRLVGVSEIRSIYNSHPHRDHLDGFDAISMHYPVGELMICFHEFYTDCMQRNVSLAMLRGVPVRHYGDGDVFTVGGATLTTYMKADPSWTLNNQSSVMMLRFGERTMLFTADLQMMGLQRYGEVLTAEELKCDILKYPHHALNLLDNAFAEKTSPRFAVITNTKRMEQPLYLMRLRGTEYEFTAFGILHLGTDGEIWAAELLQEEEITPSEVTPRPTVRPTPAATVPAGTPAP